VSLVRVVWLRFLPWLCAARVLAPGRTVFIIFTTILQWRCLISSLMLRVLRTRALVFSDLSEVLKAPILVVRPPHLIDRLVTFIVRAQQCQSLLTYCFKFAATPKSRAIDSSALLRLFVDPNRPLSQGNAHVTASPWLMTISPALNRKRFATVFQSISCSKFPSRSYCLSYRWSIGVNCLSPE
jgi:hypothetical protein